MKITQICIALALFSILAMHGATAITINSVSADTIAPGQQGTIKIEVENTLNDEVEEVSLRLDFANLPFTTVESSESSVDEISSDDEETFAFRIKASNNIAPGDYNIPYTLSYKIGNETKQRSGVIGVTVRANPELSFSLSQEKKVINQQDKISLQIINKGLGEAKFLTLRLIPDGYTLLSESQVYIGSIDSDDFETASFDVIYKEKSPIFIATIEYRDFDNKKITQTINLPLTVYTEDEALELGIIQRSNLPFYIGIIVLLVIIWLIYRTIRKRRRLARSKQGR